jgi:4-alpha-glucanotransferase
MSRRRGGVMVPLFSIPSAASWGIGELTDLPRLAAWMRRAGLSVLQLLPLHEMSPGETSPYSSMTAMALDPLYLHLPAVEEFEAIGGLASLAPADRARLDEVRASARIRYHDVRAIKMRALRAAYSRFVDAELSRDTPRAAAFQAFVRDEAWWLDEYAVFRALHAAFDERAWTDWPPTLARCEKAAVAEARAALAEEIRFRQYAQWVADGQWKTARAACTAVELYGDLTFMVSADSPDVWARQDEFRLDATVGVPPDTFSETGQDWGLPPWRWQVMVERDFAWMRARARRSAALHAGVRLDHLVGFYRTYIRPRDPGEPRVFEPPDEPTQLVLGERLVGIYKETGAEVIAEDLGTVPDFVRASIARLDVPGFKVMRWEREWQVEGEPFIDPAAYPARSVAMTGTHDTETLVEWWEVAPPAERLEICRLPSVVSQLAAGVDPGGPLTPEVRDALLGALMHGASDLVVLPIQDLFGWRDRINVPGTVTDANWTWRLPWPVDALLTDRQAVERADTIARWTAESHRASGA